MSKKKREYWPYAIVLVLVTFMSGIIYAMSIMMSTNVPMTSEDYYVQELAYQGQIDKEEQGMNDGRTPLVKVLKATSAVEVTFPGFNPELNDLIGQISFKRLSDPDMDFATAIKTEPDGKQWLSMKEVQKGLWQIQFDFEIDGTGYYHEQEIEL